MDSKENATSCPVCQEIYTDPRSLGCGHSFCLKCLQGVAGNKQTFPCPICRFDVDLRYTNVDQLPKNFVLCAVIEALDKKHQSMCWDHNRSLDIFCQRCGVVICSKCLTIKHNGHPIKDIDKIYIKRNKQLGAFLERTKQLASMTHDKSDAVKQSRIVMEKNIDSISKTVENAFKKWNDALQKQPRAIVSYLHQERDQNRQIFVEAERILAGSVTTVTGLDTDINKLRSKDTAFVVQQYSSIKKRLEDTERKFRQEIETCFTPPDTLVLEVYAPWIEEAINNIKHIDMKQTQAKPGPQKIAEIRNENVILKRECEKLRITLQELEKRKTNEVENLEYLNQCLDTLIQHLHDHVVSSAESSPITITQPAEIKPESSVAKRYQHAKEICAQFTKVENDNKELKDKTLVQGILMAALDEYVTSKKQNISLDTPTAIQLDPRFGLEHGQTTRIAQEFKEKERELSASKQEMANKINEYEQNYEKLRAEHQNLKTAYTTLQERCNQYNASAKTEKSKAVIVARFTKTEQDLDEKSFIQLLGFKNDTEEKAEEYQQKLVEKSKTEIVEKLRKTEQALNEKSVTYKTLHAKHETLQSDYTKVVNQLHEVNRLSKYAGDRFTHDNVNIADLTDADRPTKLSETYSELYDNEWTDAFEELTEDMNLSDEAAIRLLLQILMNAFRKCKEITWDRYESLKLVASTLEVKQEKLPSIITEGKQICLQSTSMTSALSIDQEKSLKIIWKATTINLKDESLKLLCANLLTCLGKPETEMPKTSKYLTCCTELCWKMGVQEKPMHLDVNAEKQVGEEKQFDTDKFRAYTKSGKSVAYVVWPACFLHEGGAILAKGIAQGCQKRVSSKE